MYVTDTQTDRQTPEEVRQGQKVINYFAHKIDTGFREGF